MEATKQESVVIMVLLVGSHSSAQGVQVHSTSDKTSNLFQIFFLGKLQKGVFIFGGWERKIWKFRSTSRGQRTKAAAAASSSLLFSGLLLIRTLTAGRPDKQWMLVVLVLIRKCVLTALPPQAELGQMREKETSYPLNSQNDGWLAVWHDNYSVKKVYFIFLSIRMVWLFQDILPSQLSKALIRSGYPPF